MLGTVNLFYTAAAALQSAAPAPLKPPALRWMMVFRCVAVE